MSIPNTTYELQPNHENRKSFYGKAHVNVYPLRKELVSYTTVVASVNTVNPEEQPKIYNMQSATTLRHIKEFLLQEGYPPMNKKELDKWYVSK